MQHKAGFYEKFVKRFLDLVLSGMALLMLSPVLLVTAMIVRVKLGSPVIFCQERPGKDEKIFRLHKFRSMSDAGTKTARCCRMRCGWVVSGGYCVLPVLTSCRSCLIFSAER